MGYVSDLLVFAKCDNDWRRMSRQSKLSEVTGSSLHAAFLAPICM